MQNLQLIIVLIVFGLFFLGCKAPEDSSVQSTSEETNNSSETLASSIISELSSNLTSTSPSRLNEFSARKATKELSNSLSSSQIEQITEAARKAVNDSNLGESENLILLMPKIIEGAQSKLASIGLSDSDEAIKVINVIVNSMVKSVNGRNQYLPDNSVDSGLTAYETIFKKITTASVSNLDEAGLSSSDIGKASSELVGTVVSSLGSSGISSSELGGSIEKITSGAVDSLDQIAGFDVSSLGSAIDNITGGATAALGDISITGFSSDNLTDMVEKVTSGATSALGEIIIIGYSADNLSAMVEKVTSGATSALGRIKISGYDSSKLTSMVEKVTAGATSSLGKIKMDGYDAGDLSGMLEKVTAGATAALGNIKMDGFSADNLSSMVEKVTSGATAALSRIQMNGFSSDNLTSMIENVKTGAKGSLGKIKMEGYNPNNKPAGLENSVNTGASKGLDKQPPMLKEITAVKTPTSETTPSYVFNSNKSGNITYGGSCTSSTTTASIGNNTISFNTLKSGTYSDCTITVRDSAGNVSSSLNVTEFKVETTTSGDTKVGFQEVYIVGSAVKKKCIEYECEKEIAVLWDLGGNMTELNNECVPVDATSHGESIYIAGESNYCVVDPEKNVVPHTLNLSSGVKKDSQEVTGIEVSSSGDVYVSGKVTKNNKIQGVYWKNGEMIKSFFEKSDWDTEKNIGVDSNGNVYMPGWKMKSHEVTHASYWKNGSLKNLTSTLDGETTDVFTSGNDVYFSGAHGHYNKGILAAYWKIGKGMTKVTKVKTYGLAKNSVWSSRASSIHVEGGTVYMAGTVNVINAGDVPVYWKNKVQHELEAEFDLKKCDYCKATPNDISVVKNDVIAVGDYYDESDFVDNYYTNGENKAALWVNKKLFKLCECCGSSSAKSVVVMDCSKKSCGKADWKTQTCSSSSLANEGKVFIRQFGTSGEDISSDITLDNSGNIYLTGYTDGAFDGNKNSGNDDFFLVKYDPSGEKQWAKQFGSNGGDWARGIAIDTSENIILTGGTTGKLTGSKNLGSYDIFLVKYDSNGSIQWTRQVGTSTVDDGHAVTTDSSDNIYITGRTWGGLDGSNKPNTCKHVTTVAGKVCSDIFLVKYGSDGEKQWTKQIVASSREIAYGVAVDSVGNIYLTGYTSGTLEGVNSGANDIFLIKYSSDGTLQFKEQFGSSGDDSGLGIRVDSKDNVYITGFTESGLDGNTNSGKKDIFLVKFNSNGFKLWTKQLGTPFDDSANGLAIDSSDNIYVTGYTEGNMYTYSGGKDVFVVKYNSSGTKQWTRQFGAPSFSQKSPHNSSSEVVSSEDEGKKVSIDSSGNIYLTGNTQGGLDGNSNSGKEDIFLIKYKSM